MLKAPERLSLIDKTLRLRVFAGPNGSGKSTIIEKVRKYITNGRHVDFGVYVNADDIAVALRSNKFCFSDYHIDTTAQELIDTANQSGLIGDRFSPDRFLNCYKFERNGGVTLLSLTYDEVLAQILADFLRQKLLKTKQKFTFETVFSHPGKLDIMKQAVEAGYKVYLYFVATESPEINIERVRLRVSKNGHHVSPDRIRSRYQRSLDLLYPAAELSYQVYFFDNSGPEPRLHEHFKNENGKKVWDGIETDDVPVWFHENYTEYFFGKKHPYLEK